MRYYEVATSRRSQSQMDVLTYSFDEAIKPGSVVTVPFGNSVAQGIVMREVKAPEFKTKSIDKLIYPEAISSELLETSKWIAEYYSAPFSSLVKAVLPSGVAKSRRKVLPNVHNVKLDTSTKRLTTDQQEALKKLNLQKPGTKILHGATGSGKTQVYIELIKSVLANQQSVIVLIPEISLTSQLVKNLSEAFNDVLLTHSKMTEAQRHKVWEDIVAKPQARVVVGPRSALFLPVKDLGLIVVDEFHDSAYKQEQSPKYSAVRVASQYGRVANAAVVLGSATPPVEDYYLAKTKSAPIATMATPVSGKRNVDLQVVDMGESDNKSPNRLFSKQLLAAIDRNLSSKQQTILFHNRRGTASMAICENCGHVFECPKCSTQLTLHADKYELRCHTCNFKTLVPNSCPECQHHTIVFKGFGTKEIESAIKKLFPTAKVARFDTDTPTKKSLANRYEELAAGKVDILIGTQMIAKGLDLPKLHTVGVILADTGLHLPDYSASESTFQLIHQVTGRVGRRNRRDEVVVQTYNPAHPAIQHGIHQDYANFYEYEIKQREKHLYPPFVHLLNITCAYSRSETAQKNGMVLSAELSRKYSGLQVLGPAPCFYGRRNNKYRWHIVLKSKSRSKLVEISTSLPANWQADLDPTTLL